MHQDLNISVSFHPTVKLDLCTEFDEEIMSSYKKILISRGESEDEAKRRASLLTTTFPLEEYEEDEEDWHTERQLRTNVEPCRFDVDVAQSRLGRRGQVSPARFVRSRIKPFYN